eukprot:8759416-Pyramimonas_sp.AAC.1
MAKATQATGTLSPPCPEPHMRGHPTHRIGGLPRGTHAEWIAEQEPAVADHAMGASGRSAPQGPARERDHRLEGQCAALPSDES